MTPDVLARHGVHHAIGVGTAEPDYLRTFTRTQR